MAEIADNVVVKVLIIREGLIAVKQLVAWGSRPTRPWSTPAAAAVGGQVRATYVSLFVGRLRSVGQVGME